MRSCGRTAADPISGTVQKWQVMAAEYRAHRASLCKRYPLGGENGPERALQTGLILSDWNHSETNWLARGAPCGGLMYPRSYGIVLWTQHALGNSLRQHTYWATPLQVVKREQDREVPQTRQTL